MYTGLGVGIPEGLGTTEFLTGGGYTRGGWVYWGWIYQGMSGYTKGLGIPGTGISVLTSSGDHQCGLSKLKQIIKFLVS